MTGTVLRKKLASVFCKFVNFLLSIFVFIMPSPLIGAGCIEMPGYLRASVCAPICLLVPIFKFISPE